MCRVRPDDWQAVTPRDEEKSLADGRCAVITRPQLIPFDTVPIAFECMDEPPKCLSLAHRVWSIADQGSPCRKLFDVFEDNHARPHELCPAYCHPCKPANCFFDGLPAFCFREVLAVRRKPCQTYRTPATRLHGVNIPDILAVVLRGRMIGTVHCNRRRVVIDCNIHASPCGKLNACRCPSAARKVIYNQFHVHPSSIAAIKSRTPFLMPSSFTNPV